MALTYTLTSNIQQRLKGRLSIGGAQSPFGQQSVDMDLLDQIGEQVEAKVNAILRQSYVFPLKAANPAELESRPLIAAIVEKGVICQLADVHFFSGEDGSSYGRQMCKDFAAELAAIESGQIRLPGEVLLTTNTLADSNYSGYAQRRPGVAEAVIW